MAELKPIVYDVELLSTRKKYDFSTPTFYSNDVDSVKVKFNVLDLDIAGASAVILINTRDGSRFSKPMTVDSVNSEISYTIGSDIGAHAGGE